MTTPTPAPPEISLAELERLVRIMGMLGSGFDHEVLVAAKQAQKWVVEHGSDWRALLTPPVEPNPVLSVGVGDPEEADAEALEAAEERGYRNGYRAGSLAASRGNASHQAAQAQATQSAQASAQAAMQQAMHQAAQASPYMHSWTSPAGSPGSGVGGPGGSPGPGQGPQPQGPAAASQGPQQASQGMTNPHPPGTWRHVAQELLLRNGLGQIPGIFRGAREEQFVTDILGRGFPNLTQAQEVWLRDIASRSGLSW